MRPLPAPGALSGPCNGPAPMPDCATTADGAAGTDPPGITAPGRTVSEAAGVSVAPSEAPLSASTPPQAKASKRNVIGIERSPRPMPTRPIRPTWP